MRKLMFAVTFIFLLPIFAMAQSSISTIIPGSTSGTFRILGTAANSQYDNMTLQAAFNYARTIGSVRFGEAGPLDVGTNKITISGDYNITLLGGVSVGYTSNTDGFITLENGASINSKAEFCTNMGVEDHSRIIWNKSNGTVTVSDGVIGGHCYPVNYNGNKLAIYNASTGAVNVTGGIIKSTAFKYNDAGYENYKDGNFYNDGIYNAGTGAVTVSGGEVERIFNASTGTVTITGGVVKNGAISSYALYNASTGAVNVRGNAKMTSSIGGIIFNGSSGKITISENAEISSNFVGLSSLIHLEDSGTNTGVRLEITGGLVQSESENGSTPIENFSSGAVVISGGRVERHASGNTAYAIVNKGTGELRISNSAYIYSGGGRYGSAILNESTGKITVSGNAHIKGDDAAAIRLANFGDDTGVRLEMTGGKVENNYALGHAIYSDSKGKIIISGGTIEAHYTSIGNYGGGDLSVSGAKIRANEGYYGSSRGITNNGGGNLSISGGAEIFSQNGRTVEHWGLGKLTISGDATKISSGHATNSTIYVQCTFLNGFSQDFTCFEMTGGTVENEFAGYAIENSRSQIIISGGKVEANEGTAIYSLDGNVIVDGGSIESKDGNAIYIRKDGYANSSSNVEIRGGVVQVGAGGTAIENNNGTLTVRGGAVQTAGGGTAIEDGWGGKVNLLGGTISAAGGRAYNGTGSSELTLGNAPNITGIIKILEAMYFGQNTLSVIVGENADAFNPGSKVYELEVTNPRLNYRVVTNGAAYLGNFAFANNDWNLEKSDNNIMVFANGYAKTGNAYVISQVPTLYKMQDVINSIKANAKGTDCSIQFGINDEELDIGSDGIKIEGTGWGKVTLLGNITNTNTTTITVDGPNVESRVNIAKTSPEAIINNGTGTLTISGGTLVATDNTVFNRSSGTTIITGNASVKAANGTAVGASSTGKIIISENAEITSANTNSSYGTLYIVGCELEMTGGKVRNTSATSGYAIYVRSGRINISGGNVEAMGTTASAVYTSYGTSTNIITISENAEITSASTRRTVDIGANSVLEMTGGTVRNTSTTSGYAIYVSSSGGPSGGTVNISGGNVEAMGTTASAVYASDGTVNISGGNVEAMEATASAVYTSYGKVNISGGTIKNTADGGNAVSYSYLVYLDGKPIIEGKIIKSASINAKLIVSETFAPDGETYLLDFATYSNGAIAVQNGKEHFESFAILNQSYGLAVSGEDIILGQIRTVAFNLNGGVETVPASAMVINGGTITAPDGEFTRQGYITEGKWYTTVAGSTEFKFGETKVTGDMTLYLRWTAAQVTINTEALDGGNMLKPYEYKILSSVEQNAGGTIKYNRYSGSLPAGLTLAEDGTISGTPTQIGTFTYTVNAQNFVEGTTSAIASAQKTFTITIAQAYGGEITGTSTLVNKTHNSIIITAVAAPSSGQAVEYAISTSNAAPESGWQTTLSFRNLSINTTYYVFARAKSNTNYSTGAASLVLTATTSAEITARTYVITKGTSNFNVFGIDNGTNITIANAIAYIRNDANGEDCSIQFGETGEELNMGTSGVTIDGTGWGKITLLGRITNTSSSVATIIVNGPDVESKVNIAKTNPYAIRNNGAGTLTISGGTIVAAYYAVYNASTGKITISENAVISSSTTNASYGTVHLVNGTAEIIGGTIRNTANGNAVYYGAAGTSVLLGGNPIIEGKIRKASGTGTLGVLPSFAPVENTYMLDFASYSSGAIAVLNGKAEHIGAFSLSNASYTLVAVGDDIVMGQARTVAFNLNGASGNAPATISVLSNSVVENAPAGPFSREGYATEGKWYTSATGSTEFIFGETKVTSNMTLYLRWTAAKVTIDTDALASGQLNSYYEDEISASIEQNAGGTIKYSLARGSLPAGLTLADNGTISGTPTQAGTFSNIVITAQNFVNGTAIASVQKTFSIAIEQVSGATIAGTTTLDSKSYNSITINAVTAPSNGQAVEYAISTSDAAPASGWQTTLYFGNLQSNTTYYVFARAKSNANFGTGVAALVLTETTNNIVHAQAPAITTQPQDRTVSLGGSLTLDVVAVSNDGGTLSYQWYRNGVAISGATGATYTPSTAEAGRYVYSVVVTNTISNNGDGGIKTQTVTSASAAVVAGDNTVVGTYGRLQACNSHNLCSEPTPVSLPVPALKGVSLGWSNTGWESSNFFNANVVNTMVDSWNAKVVRVPVGYEINPGKGEYYGSYLADKAGNMARAKAAIDAALAKGVYVIIDWHSHSAHLGLADAMEFFEEMAALYGHRPNVIFEIYNEPLNIPWQSIKSYAEQIIRVIREHSQNLIIVGTPNWAQDIDAVVAAPLTDNNVAYVAHFYAATHSQSWLGSKIDAVRNAGRSVFVSEFGTVSADGNGAHNQTAMDLWKEYLSANNIPAAAWHVNNKNEASSYFKPTFNPSTDNFTDQCLMTESGRYIYNWLTGVAINIEHCQPETEPDWTGKFCDYADDPSIIENPKNCWPISNENDYANCNNYGNMVDACPANDNDGDEPGDDPYDGEATRIDDFANSDSPNISRTGEEWFVSMWGKTTKHNPINYTEGRAELLGITASTTEADDWSGVTLGLKASNNGTKYNLSQCAGGFRYEYKGEAHNFSFELKTGEWNSTPFFAKTAPSSMNWESVEIIPTTGNSASDLSGPGEFQWKISPPLPWNIENGSLLIRNFECLGELILPKEELYDGVTTQIDDFANSNSQNVAKTGESWFAFGNATHNLNYTAGRAELLGITASTVEEDWSDFAQAVLALSAANNGDEYDLSQCVSGFSYEYQGASHSFSFGTADYVTYLANTGRASGQVLASSNWKTVEIPSFAKEGASSEILDLSRPGEFRWTVRPFTLPWVIENGSLRIRNFKCLGELTLPIAVEPPDEEDLGEGEWIMISDFAGDAPMYATTGETWGAYTSGNATYSNANSLINSAEDGYIEILDIAANQANWNNFSAATISLEARFNGDVYNLSQCKAFSYEYRGNESHRFDFVMKNGEEYYGHTGYPGNGDWSRVPASSEWETKVFKNGHFQKADIYSASTPTSVGLSEVNRMRWTVRSFAHSKWSVSGRELQIRNFKCFGDLDLTNAPKTEADRCEAAGNNWVGGECVPNICKNNDNEPLYCRWGNECVEMNTMVSSCETLKAECVQWGSVYANVPESGLGATGKCAGGTWTGEGKGYFEGKLWTSGQTSINVPGGESDWYSFTTETVEVKAFDFITKNIAGTDGLCVSYASDGPIDLALAWDDEKYGYNMPYITLPANQNGGAPVVLSWDWFNQDFGWDLVEAAVQKATQEAKGLRFEIKNGSDQVKKANFILTELGWNESCDTEAPNIEAICGAGYIYVNGECKAAIEMCGINGNTWVAEDTGNECKTPEALCSYNGGAWRYEECVPVYASLLWNANMEMVATPSSEAGWWYGFKNNDASAAFNAKENDMHLKFVTGAFTYVDGSDIYANEAAIGFDFKDDESGENISGADGLCLVYSSDVDVALRLGWDYDSYGYNVPYVMLPANKAGGKVEISWSEFEQEPYWGEVENAIQIATTGASALHFILKNSEPTAKTANLILTELGWGNSCTAEATAIDAICDAGTAYHNGECKAPAEICAINGNIWTNANVCKTPAELSELEVACVADHRVWDESEYVCTETCLPGSADIAGKCIAINGTYAIAQSSGKYSVNEAGEFASVQNAIDAIKTHANGHEVSIAFNNLESGEGISFAGDWGSITLSGNITSIGTVKVIDGQLRVASDFATANPIALDFEDYTEDLIAVAGSTNAEFFTLVESDYALAAKEGNLVVKRIYTVTVNGGVANATSAIAGSEIAIEANEAAEGLEFKGWNVVSGDVTIADDTFTMPLSNVVIEAVFQARTYTVAYSLNGGSGSAIPDAVIVAHGLSIDNAPASVFTKTGFTQGMWHYLNVDNQETEFKFGETPVIGDMELYLKWTPAEVAITTDENLPNGTYGVQYPAQMIDAETASGDLVFTLKDGSSLPAGFLSENGAISFMPTKAGLVEFTVVATNAQSGQSAEKLFNIFIDNAEQDIPDIAGIAATSTAETITITGMEAGVQVSIDNGEIWQDSPIFIELMPKTDYEFVFRFKEKPNYNASEASAPKTFRTLVAPVVITTGAQLAGGTYGVAYTAQLAAKTSPDVGGNFTFALQGASLPAGVEISADGLVSVTPEQVGDITFTVVATCTESGESSEGKQFTISIGKATLAVADVEVPTFTAEYDLSKTLADIELPQGWSWNEATEIPTVAKTQYLASYLRDENHNALENVNVIVNVSRKPIAVPSANPDWVYDGSSKIGVNPGEGYTLSGANATNSGTHTAIATLDANYTWNDGANPTEPKQIAWIIDRASQNAPDVTGVELTARTSATITFSAIAGVEISIDGSNWFAGPKTFDGLNPGTDYTFYFRKAGNANYKPSETYGELTFTTLKLFVVAFNFNGDDGATEQVKVNVEEGNAIDELSIPSIAGVTRTGYLNDGKWYADAAGTTEFAFSESITSNATLYLKWTSITVLATACEQEGKVWDNESKTCEDKPIKQIVNPTECEDDEELVNGECIVSPIAKSFAAHNLGILKTGESFLIQGLTRAETVRIVDVKGKMLMSKTVMPNESVSISHLPKGMYLVNVNGKTFRMVK